MPSKKSCDTGLHIARRFYPDLSGDGVSELAEHIATALDEARAERADEFEKLADPAAVTINMMVGKIAKPPLSSLLHVYGLYDDFAQVLEIAARNEDAPEIDRVRIAIVLPKESPNV